jgi:hypothetical protein
MWGTMHLPLVVAMVATDQLKKKTNVVLLMTDLIPIKVESYLFLGRQNREY